MVRRSPSVRKVPGSNPGLVIGTLSKITNSLFISKEIGDGCISLSLRILSFPLHPLTSEDEWESE